MTKPINALYKDNHLLIDPEILLEVNSNYNQYIFLKDASLRYQYANKQFLNLLGVCHFNHLQNLHNKDFYTDKKAIKCYQNYDEYILEEAKTLTVCETIFPRKYNKITQQVEGKLYPLFHENGNVSHILGIVTPKVSISNLDWNTLFMMPQAELNQILLKRSYPITCNGYQTTLSKMEIKTLIQLIKGETANEIAETLQIKQTTVESYLRNIRNKLSVSSKSELIDVLIQENILNQILV